MVQTVVLFCKYLFLSVRAGVGTRLGPNVCLTVNQLRARKYPFEGRGLFDKLYRASETIVFTRLEVYQMLDTLLTLKSNSRPKFRPEEMNPN